MIQNGMTLPALSIISHVYHFSKKIWQTLTLFLSLHNISKIHPFFQRKKEGADRVDAIL